MAGARIADDAGFHESAGNLRRVIAYSNLNRAKIPLAMAGASVTSFSLMDFKATTPATTEDDLVEPSMVDADTGFRISPRPVVSRARKEDSEDEASHLPRSYGTETLTLLARDPHTVFAFWDIDWNTAFRDLKPKEHKVYLRLSDSDGKEQTSMEVEPMAGSCYVTVADADAGYRGEIGFQHPANGWHCLASSALVTTPPDAYTADEEVDFVTVPFHLSFQRIVDLLEVTQQENATLTAMLADLSVRLNSAVQQAELTPEQRDLGHALQAARSAAEASAAARRSSPQVQRKLERILGFGGTGPSSGFGGSSRIR
jgi:hypothetical protein